MGILEVKRILQSLQEDEDVFLDDLIEALDTARREMPFNEDGHMMADVYEWADSK